MRNKIFVSCEMCAAAPAELRWSVWSISAAFVTVVTSEVDSVYDILLFY